MDKLVLNHMVRLPFLKKKHTPSHDLVRALLDRNKLDREHVYIKEGLHHAVVVDPIGRKVYRIALTTMGQNMLDMHVQGLNRYPDFAPKVLEKSGRVCIESYISEVMTIVSKVKLYEHIERILGSVPQKILNVKTFNEYFSLYQWQFSLMQKQELKQFHRIHQALEKSYDFEETTLQVIHGDLTHENLLYDGEWRLTDFSWSEYDFKEFDSWHFDWFWNVRQAGISNHVEAFQVLLETMNEVDSYAEGKIALKRALFAHRVMRILSVNSTYDEIELLTHMYIKKLL